MIKVGPLSNPSSCTNHCLTTFNKNVYLVLASKLLEK
ncbi:hypothetical protein BVRB_2g026430 [Beta vulgaris subsp. vulgaris]|nr:hypothetical protein BVRB_2g026430 [Beta vulgaris subsp. vulgaris]